LLLSRKIYSWLRVGLSVTLSGMGLGFAQMIGLLSIQPSCINAKTSRHGITMSCFALYSFLRQMACLYSAGYGTILPLRRQNHRCPTSETVILTPPTTLRSVTFCSLA